MDEEVDHVGKYRFPHKVIISYEAEEDLFCATCEMLEIASCAHSLMEAKRALEAELEDAIELYVHLFKEEDLSPKAKQYRELLAEIKW